MNNSRLTALAAEKSFEKKQKLLDAAKMHLEGLKKRLIVAKEDVIHTNRAAVKASAAARQATVIANRDKRTRNSDILRPRTIDAEIAIHV